MTKKERAKRITDVFEEQFKIDIKCFLNYETAFQLLIATMMSAQCTDKRVNEVTKDLFVKYPDASAVAAADFEEFAEDIKSVGFYNTKAKNIIATAKVIHEKYNDEVPSDIDALTALPGVGRKTANVVRGNIFGIESIVVDTHVLRISNRLGLVNSDDPVKTEYELMKALPSEKWIAFNHQGITFGRNICTAQRPKCEMCPLTDICVYYKQKTK